MNTSPVLADYPKPTVTVVDLVPVLIGVLDQLQRHAAVSEDDAEMRRLVLAGTHVAMASSLLRPGVAGAGAQVNTQAALAGLQVLVTKGGVHEH